MPQEFNLPDKNDPQFADKLVNMIRSLFEDSSKQIQNFTPISTPEEGTQIGSVWYDKDTHELKVSTANGIKTLQYVP